MSRAVAVLVILLTLGAAACSGDGGPGDSGSDSAFLDKLFADRTATSLDFTQVDDSELVAAGRAFCSRLDGINGEGEAEGTGGPTTDDFETVAQHIKGRFTGEVKNLDGSPSSNGDIVLAYSVGIAAVNTFCPDLSSALG